MNGNGHATAPKSAPGQIVVAEDVSRCAVDLSAVDHDTWRDLRERFKPRKDEDRESRDAHENRR